MKPVFVAKKNHRPTSLEWDGSHRLRSDEIVFTPACQHLPGFHTIPRMTPWERLGLWFIIDF
ncbi:MAG TPA: hypothetical protein PLZ86_01180 [bacterium]|nr:hypothetical protein [bacterium]